MTVFAAMLRAVNVGGSGKLSMTELKAICERIGLISVSTYIQSGNAVFSSALAAGTVEARLDDALKAHMGKPPGVFVRSSDELSGILSATPFAEKPGNQVGIFFFHSALDPAVAEKLVTPGHEEVAFLGREVHIWYPDGMGRSKLKLPGLSQATARNLNTVRRLSQMTGMVREH